MTRREEARATIRGKIAGTEVGALSTSLDARWMMAYAAALGLDDPRYYDTLAEGGPVAHPLFSVCYEWPAVLALRSKAVRESWALLGVHSTHHVVIHRLPSAADRLLKLSLRRAIRLSRFSIRAGLVLKRGTSLHSGRSMRAQSAANCRSLPTASVNSPSAARNG